MQFNSSAFAIFLAVVYPLYLLARERRLQNLLLLAASYFFYGCWDWRYLSLILLSSSIDYTCGRALSVVRHPRKRKLIVAASLVTSLGILGFFKYFNFFAESLHDLLGGFGLSVPLPALEVVLPVGISFYTFQTLSYTIDVYRGKCKSTLNYLEFLLFVSFFPQLVAGPIERASHLLGQFQVPRTVTLAGIRSGVWLIFWGLFKKVFVADNMAPIANDIFSSPETPAGGAVLLGIYAFAFQIYADFSGYSSIARGLAHLMGFELMVNFDNPYLAQNPRDFWSRWHISLSTWLRDYLYIPLGGNRGGASRTYRNLVITMLLGGLWHGAAWTFVLWGLFHGTILVIHRLLSRGPDRRMEEGVTLRKAANCVFFFHVTCVGWLLFRAETVGQVGSYLAAIATSGPVGFETFDALRLVFYAAPIFLIELLPALPAVRALQPRLGTSLKAAGCGLLFYLFIAYGSSTGESFIYFQF